jgi:hypothetical protein
MYFPYFYGRRSELTALRNAWLDFGAPQRILPIIEPVTAPRPLVRFLTDASTVGLEFYVVINPALHDLVATSAQAAWATAAATVVADPTLVRPTLKERASTTAAELTAFVAAHPGRELGVVLASSRIAPAHLAAAVGTADVTVFLLPGVDSLGYAGALGATRVVSVRDNFRPEARNADYSGEEWFGNNHLAWMGAGQPGFSDFSILPGAFNAGGGPVGAVAFHLTFKDPASQDFWIQHFVSDEQQQYVGTAQTKLLEAIAHLDAQITTTPTRFTESPAIDSYLDQLSTGAATNLEGNKRLQIGHHLHEVARHLGI